MEPRIETLPEKIFIGMRMVMSLSNDRTGELWKNFMPRRKEIQNNTGTALYSIRVYDHLYFRNFNPDTAFEKWAAIGVSDLNTIPEDMESFILGGGLYAVFLHKGSSTDDSTFQYIFTSWLPDSDYVLDDRPHFEILGKKYIHEDPRSEEEIFLPIKLKDISHNSYFNNKYV